MHDLAPPSGRKTLTEKTQRIPVKYLASFLTDAVFLDIFLCPKNPHFRKGGRLSHSSNPQASS